MKNKVSERLGNLMLSTYCEIPVQEFLDDLAGQIDSIEKDHPNHTDLCIIIGGDIYEQEFAVHGLRDKTEKELLKEKRKREAAKRKRKEGQSLTEKLEREQLAKLKAKYE